MRNKYEGFCCKCGKIVAANKGCMVKHLRGWKIAHEECMQDNNKVKE